MERIQLFCIPFAGGSAFAFRALKDHLPERIEVVPVELPGRGARFRDPLLPTIRELTDDVWRTIRPRLDGPYAFFGHSMGASIGYQLCRRIESEGHPLPGQLFVSAKSAPEIPFLEKDWHTLPSEMLWKKLSDLGGVPQEIIANDELRILFEPIIRSDFKAEALNPYDGPAGLRTPVTVIRGTEDNIPKEEAQAWQNETVRPVTFYEFPGNHFYLFDRWAEVGSLIAGQLGVT